MKSIIHTADTFDAQLRVLVGTQGQIKNLVNELAWDALRHSFVHGDASLCRKLMAAIESATYYAAPKALIEKCLGHNHEFKKNILETGKKMGDSAYDKRLKTFEEIEGQYDNVFTWYDTVKVSKEKPAPTLESVTKRITALVDTGMEPRTIAIALLKTLTLTQDDMLAVLGEVAGVEYKMSE